MVGTKSAQAIEDMVAVSNIFLFQKSFFYMVYIVGHEEACCCFLLLNKATVILVTPALAWVTGMQVSIHPFLFVSPCTYVHSSVHAK